MSGMFINSSASSSASLSNKIIGLRRGVVKEIKDPDKLNRVKVVLTDETLELPYADVTTTFANKESGVVFVPQVNDEVIVGFLDGKINDPVILGTVYNNVNKPPLAIDEKNEIMMIKFPSGMTIQIDNTKDKAKVTLTTKKGHSVLIDDDKEFAEIKEKSGKTSFTVDFKNGEIALKADKKISLTAGKDSLIVENQKGVAITSSAGKLNVDVNEVAVKAKSNLNMQANARVVVKGNGGAEVSSSGQTVLKGSVTQIN